MCGKGDADGTTLKLDRLHKAPRLDWNDVGDFDAVRARLSVCRASQNRKKYRRRSITLRHFAKLADVRGVSFVSLQKGQPRSQTLSPPPGLLVHDWTDELHDFGDTAALIECLDLVISVDTSVVHLAGAPLLNLSGA